MAPLWLFFPPGSLMGYAYNAQPFIYVTKLSVNLQTMDYAYNAQPFVSYYRLLN